MAKLQYSKLSVVVLLALLTSCQNPINSILQQKAEYKHATAKFSNEVILHEAAANKKILLQVRNLTCAQFTEKLEKSLLIEFHKQGFNITADPLGAGFLLQANIVQCAKTTHQLLQQTLQNGYAGTVEANTEPAMPQQPAEEDANVVLSIVADLKISEQVMPQNTAAEFGTIKTQQQTWKQYRSRLSISKTPLHGRDFNSTAGWLIAEMASSVVGVFRQ